MRHRASRRAGASIREQLILPYPLHLKKRLEYWKRVAEGREDVEMPQMSTRTS